MRVVQMATVTASSASSFEAQFNAKTKELAGKKIVETKTEIGAESFIAIIMYEEDIDDAPKTVRDEYHDRGLVYLCRQCPHIELPTDKRRKHIDCKYDEYGHTMLDCECCEMFYKELKQGSITPRYLR